MYVLSFFSSPSSVLCEQVCSEGLIYARVTRIGKASALQQIVRLVEQAQVKRQNGIVEHALPSNGNSGHEYCTSNLA